MKSAYPFILIDDDPVNNMICQMTIEMVQGKSNIVSFVNPETGFKFIQSEYSEAMHGEPTILLLDLNMPIMSGWEFLERFDNLPLEIKDMIKIYILSSSIDERDKDRSYANKNVHGFITKPLTTGFVDKVINE